VVVALVLQHKKPDLEFCMQFLRPTLKIKLSKPLVAPHVEESVPVLSQNLCSSPTTNTMNNTNISFIYFQNIPSFHLNIRRIAFKAYIIHNLKKFIIYNFLK
jgi:hypothetical protein